MDRRLLERVLERLGFAKIPDPSRETLDLLDCSILHGKPLRLIEGETTGSIHPTWGGAGSSKTWT